MQLIFMHNGGRRLLLIVAGLAAAGCPAARGQQFTVTDLGTLGGPAAGAFGVNANQIVVGYSALANANFHGFLWDGSIHNLLPLAGDTQSHAFGINGLGQAVGVSYILGGLTAHAMLWQGGAGSTLGGFAPRGINDAGTVVGYASSAINGRGWVEQACVLRGGTFTSLGTLGGSFSYAYDSNSADQIVGMSYTTGENARRACLWQNGQIIDLGTLGGANSQAYAVNEARQVVGVSDTGTGVPHAFLYALNSQGQVISRTDLGELGGGYSYAYAINASSEVVGTSNSHAFYWRPGGMVDLSRRIPADSGWVLNSAMAINMHGQIVGLGTYQGWPHAFMVSPAPPDYDYDGDVDQEDFGHFQACFTGPSIPQNDPSCWNALLDGNTSVDSGDLTVFEHCLSGPGISASPDCWR